MAEMEVRETTRGEFLWQWTASEKPSRERGADAVVAGGLPRRGTLLRCGDSGLRGRMAIDGVGKGYSAAMVRVYWLDGRSAPTQ